jgi:hypothetical protein
MVLILVLIPGFVSVAEVGPVDAGSLVDEETGNH